MARLPGRSRGKTVLFAELTVLIGLGLLEVGSYLLIGAANRVLTEPIMTRAALLQAQSDGLHKILTEARRDRLHEDLGWIYQPGYAEMGDTLNQAGMRSSREYDPSPDDSLPRIAAYGDSFVYCTEVSNDDCWSAFLEAGWNAEVLNFGVGGYGTDQALLRYLADGTAYSPDIVLIGFAPVDLRRAVNRYRRFLSQSEGPWSKPRFKLVDGEFELVPTPFGTREEAELLVAEPTRVIEFGVDDYWYESAIYQHALYRWSALYRLSTNLWIRLKRRYFDPDRLFKGGVFSTESEAFTLQSELLLAFADSVEGSGARPQFLFLPGREDVQRQAEGLPPTYEPLAEFLTERGFELIDPLEAFLATDTPRARLFAAGGHYSAAGNRILAGVIAEALGLAPR